jgi:hypothetical protein
LGVVKLNPIQPDPKEPLLAVVFQEVAILLSNCPVR